MTPFPHVVCASGMRLGVPASCATDVADAAMRVCRDQAKSSFCAPSGALRVNTFAPAAPGVTEIGRRFVSAGEGASRGNGQ